MWHIPNSFKACIPDDIHMHPESSLGYCGQKQVLHRTVHRSGPDSLISGWKNSMLLFPENTTTPQCYTSLSQTRHTTANFVPF